MTVSIVSPSAAAVSPPSSPVSNAKTSPEIDPVLKAFGRHIARSFHRGRGVHIPAMKNTAFGQVLRTLELKRAFVADEVSRPAGAATTETFYDISCNHHDRPGSRQPCADVPRDLLTG